MVGRKKVSSHPNPVPKDFFFPHRVLFQSFYFCLSSSCRNCAFSLSPPYAPFLPKQSWKNRQMNELNNHFKIRNQSVVDQSDFGKQSHWTGSRHLKELLLVPEIRHEDVPAAFLIMRKTKPHMFLMLLLFSTSFPNLWKQTWGDRV